MSEQLESRGAVAQPKKTRSPRILFISHSAGRTGAPIMLLHFIRWLQSNTAVEIVVLLRDGGELELQFADAGKTWLFDGWRISRASRLLQKVLQKVFRLRMSPGPRKRRNLLHTLRRLEIDLVYSNTITNGEVLEWLEPLRLPVLTHVHEMSHWIERCGQKNFELVKKNSVFYVAASKAVREELHEHWGITPDQIEVVYEFIPTNTPVPSAQVREEVRRLLAVPKRSFLVVGSGVETWRKGKDLFVDLALEVDREQPDNNIRFLWVGAWENREHEMEFQARIRSEGLQGRVIFIGQVDNPLDYFSAADVFAMTSREDPYPLVCLEAALMGLPVLCFENAGGMPEFVEQDAGMIFPYLDVAAMAKGIVELSMSLEKMRILGDAARAKVKSRHDVTVGGSQLRNVISGLLNSLSAI